MSRKLHPRSKNFSHEGADDDDDEQQDWSMAFFDSGVPTAKTTIKDEKKNTETSFYETPVASAPNSQESTAYSTGHGRTIIHIDVDCFYAQVEMIRDPTLTKKPLGIQQKNIIVTCNYEARKYGVTKLMFISDALKKCPQLVLVSGEDLTHYREMSYKITEHLTKYSKLVERLGFDENFVDVTELISMPPWKSISDPPIGHVYGEPVTEEICPCGCAARLSIGSHIAAEMRRTLCEELQITCCAGTAYNKLLAKMVGSVHKPNQQTLIYHSSVMKYMHSITDVRSIPGIGRKCSQRLEGLGVTSVQQLQECDVTALEEEFGHQMAHTLRQLSFGQDPSEVVITGQPQSLSDEDSFKKCDTVDDAKCKLNELIENLLKRLILDGRIAQTLRVTVRKYAPDEQRYRSNNRQSKQSPIPGHIFRNLNSSTMEAVLAKLMPLAEKLLHKLVDTSRPFHLTLINVCFSNLCQPGAAAQNSIASFFKPTTPTSKIETKASFRDKQVSKESQNQTCTEDNIDICVDGKCVESDMNGNKSRIASENPISLDKKNSFVNKGGAKSHCIAHEKTNSPKMNESKIKELNHQGNIESCVTSIMEYTKELINEQCVPSNKQRGSCSNESKSNPNNEGNFMKLDSNAYCGNTLVANSLCKSTSVDISKLSAELCESSVNKSEPGFHTNSTSINGEPLNRHLNPEYDIELSCHMSSPTETLESKSSLITSLSGLLPTGVDANTFVELPRDIQCDLLTPGQVNTQTKKQILNIVSKISLLSETHLHDEINCEEQYLTRDKTTYNAENGQGPSDKPLVDTDTCKHNNKAGDNTAPILSTDIDMQAQDTDSITKEDVTCDNPVRSSPDRTKRVGKSTKTENISGQSSSQIQTSPKSSLISTQNAEKHQPHSSNDLETHEIPADIDPEVFKALPDDIKKSLIAEWKVKQEFQVMKKRKLSSPESRKTPAKRKSSGNILTFFKKQ